MRAPRAGVAVLAALCLAGCAQRGTESTVSISPTPTEAVPAPPPLAPSAGSSPTSSSVGRGGARLVETVASGLDQPWGLAFFPNGDALVTEQRTARVVRISGQDRVAQEVGTLPGVTTGEGSGALGVAIAPDYPADRSVYFFLTTADDNQIVRAPLEGGVLGTPEVLLDGIPRAYDRDGGRLAFGPDGYLYAGTGDAAQPALAADPASLAGKVLRITTEGDPAPGNPFDSPVWASGLRDPGGLAFDDRGRLWVADSGEDSVDELDLVRAGDDLGWPNVAEGPGTSADRRNGYTPPLHVWPLAEAGPGGLAYAEGRLWMGALRGERLWSIPAGVSGASRPTGLLRNRLGRIQTTATAPDGSVWLTTANRGAGGEADPADDRILRLRP